MKKNSFSPAIKTLMKYWFNLSYAGVMISCAFIALAVILNVLSNSVEGFDDWLSNLRKSSRYEFDVDHFPENYRSETLWNKSNPSSIRIPSMQQWISIWFDRREPLQEYQFKNGQLREIASQVYTQLYPPHPIWEVEGVTVSQLERIPVMTDIKTFVDFTVTVDQIAFRETNVGRQPDWGPKVEQWELEQTQVIILYMYLIYLDKQSNLTPEIYEEATTLFNELGQEVWYTRFRTHLDIYWP